MTLAKRHTTMRPPAPVSEPPTMTHEEAALEIAKAELVRKLEALSIKQLAALVMGKNVRLRGPHKPPSGTFQRVRIVPAGSPEDARERALAKLGKR